MEEHAERQMATEMDEVRDRFRSRILRLAFATVVVDLVAAGAAYLLERGASHAFPTLWDALFWTTTQLLTVSSQLPNPQHTATKVLDVALELWGIVVVTSLAATFTDLLHHRTRHAVRRRLAREGPAG